MKVKSIIVKNVMQLITPLVFMLFFVTTAGAQSETNCDPRDCNVKCCSPKTCAELVSAGICTPEQVASCKAKTSGETRVASAIKVKHEVKSSTCVKTTAKNACVKKESKSCAPASSTLVYVEKLETPRIKPITKDQ